MRTLAATLALIGGALLVYAGLSGNAGLWELVGEAVKVFLEDPGQRQILEWTIRVLIVIASLGGFSVIAGGLLIYWDKKLIGQILIFVGAATGLIGIVVGVLMTTSQGGSVTDYFVNQLNGTAGLVGVLLSYAARRAV